MGWFLFHRRRCALMAAAALVLMQSGCSKEKLDALVEQAKQKAGEAAESVKETAKAASENTAQAAQTIQEKAGLAGTAEIMLDAPLRTQACYVRFFAFSDGRPSLLQLTSALQAEQETFPSVFVHAKTNAASLSELVGQVIPAQVYVMTQPQGPIWRSAEGEHVELKINAVDAKSVKAELIGGVLNQADGGGSATAAGSFDAQVL